MSDMGWQCPYCKHGNPFGTSKCNECLEIAPPAVSIIELPTLTIEAPQIVAKQGSSAKKDKTSAKAKVNEELDLEDTFLQYWRRSNTGYEFVRQYRGIVKRIDKKGKPVMTNHKFDFALPDYMLAIEIQGGIFSRGRHVRPKGYHDDRAKIRKAILQGWTVLEYTTIDIKQGLHIAVAEILERIAQVENVQKGRAA